MKKLSIFILVFSLLALATSAFAGEAMQASGMNLGDLLTGGIGAGFMAMGSVKMLNLPHLDANESIFFARELEFVKSRSYDKKYAELKARLLIPVSSEAEPWADAIVYESYDQVGAAKLIAGYSDDLPRADVKGQEFINPVKSLGCSYGYNIMEIRKSQARGKSLEQRKANAAKRAILQKENELAFVGDAKTGLKGFLNHNNVPLAVIADDNTNGSTEWLDTDGATPLKSSKQILRDLHQIANTIVNQTQGVEHGTTLVLPRTLYLYIASTPYGIDNEATILDVFLKQSMFIKEVDWLNELETAGVGGSKRAMAYRRDPEAVTLEIPQDFEQFDPQARNLEFVVPCHSRFGGVLFYYPLSAVYADDL